MKTILPPKIITVEQAKNFLKALFDNGEAFHPEDDANDVSFGMEVTAQERALLNKLMDEIYALGDFDPCEYLNQFIEDGTY
jgi:hypothetical protein